MPSRGRERGCAAGAPGRQHRAGPGSEAERGDVDILEGDLGGEFLGKYLGDFFLGDFTGDFLGDFFLGNFRGNLHRPGRAVGCRPAGVGPRRARSPARGGARFVGLVGLTGAAGPGRAFE
ncbi:MAG: hypothetical protein H0T76_08295, partial [Nannocystis sp.]